MTWSEEAWSWAKKHWLDLAVFGPIGVAILWAIVMNVEPPGILVWVVTFLALFNHYRLKWREEKDGEA